LDSSGASLESKSEEEEEGKEQEMVTKSVILSDGTYGTEIVKGGGGVVVDDEELEAGQPIRKALISSNNVFLAMITCVNLTKLTLKMVTFEHQDERLVQAIKALKVSTLLTISNLGSRIQSLPNASQFGDCEERLHLLARSLIDESMEPHANLILVEDEVVTSKKEGEEEEKEEGELRTVNGMKLVR